ncbi:MAG TPA: hypothetical protein VM328_08705, partial [Fimbriimonadaceae bacterium]|nr:hypothetical protein [Fimbriimonadaceae bacterium]
MTMFASCAASIGLAISGTPVNTGALQKWFDSQIFQRISINGTRRLGYHLHDVDGDLDAYTTTNYFGMGGRRFTDFGNLSLQGRNVLGVLNFNMTLSDNRFQDPQSQRISIDYSKGPLTVNLGDIRGSLLNTNRFASFNKALDGAMAGYKSGRLHVKGVRSESKGSARTISLTGNNSSGPYYLQSSQLISGSEQVQLDGRVLELGRDYVINYESGSITFLNEAPGPTSSIVVSFEAYGYNANRGTIEGVGATYDMGKWGRIGLTSLEQKTGGAGRLSSRLEQFEGFGPPSTPYFLQFEPLQSRPVTVRVDGQLQVRAAGPDDPGDYFFDPLNPAILYFKRFMPASSQIDVIYTPKPTQTVEGDRRVVGIDYRLPIGDGGRNGYIGYSQATGQLRSSTPLSGTARALDGSYLNGPLEVRASLRDVPDGFVTIESRGLNRNEKAFDLSATYKGGAWSYGATHRNSSVSLRRAGTDGSISFTRSRVSDTRAHANLVQGEKVLWSVEQARSVSQFGGEESRLDTTSVVTNRRFGKIDARFAFEHQTGFGPLSQGTRGDISLDTLKARADWHGGGGLAVGLRSSLSSIRAGGKSGAGTDLGINASYNPNSKLRLEGAYTVSDSGQLATLGGFRHGAGIGYDGNGFSGGVPGALPTLGGSKTRELSLRGRYQPSDRIGIDAGFYRTFMAGAYSSNSETSAYSLGVNWDLRQTHRLYVALDKSNTRFVSSPLTSDALSVSAGLE